MSTRSPTYPQFTPALSLHPYKPRWGPDSCHPGNRRGKVVTQTGCRVGRAMRLTWVFRCESNRCSLKAPRRPRATMQRDWGCLTSPRKRRKVGSAHSVVRRSAVRVTPGDMRTRPTGGRYTHARCAISFVVAKMRCRGTLGINTSTKLQSHWNQRAPEGNAPDSSHQGSYGPNVFTVRL